MAEKRVAAVGWPIEHSLSPAMHNAAFRAVGLHDWHYDKYAVPPDILGLSLREMRDHGFIGCNITVPHKQEALKWTRADALSQRVGAVNTIDFRTNRGTNTDVQGFMDDLAAHGVEVANQPVIVLGAGGAARAAVYGLSDAGAHVIVVNRTPEKAERLLADLFVKGEALPLEQAHQTGAKIIVNCTSAGMHPAEDTTPWDPDVPFPEGAFVYDMVYRPAQTRLMRQAQAAGGQAVNGLGMLARQGALAFTLWTGVEAPLEVMLQTLRDALGITT